MNSSINLFPHWHGIEVLGGLPLFMKYHYYTLKMRDKNGKILIMEWKYAIYKQRLIGKEKKWSQDFSVDKAEGLMRFYIK